MPELRQNMATKEWVLIASERAKRPHEFVCEPRQATHERPGHVETCPFCPGNESQTLDPVLRWPVEGPWQLRVTPNKFPALRREGARVHCVEGVHRKLSGVGFHEVLIESPLHNTTTALQSAHEIALTLKAFQARGREIIQDPRIEQIFYFKNHGPRAGTSVEHPHSQILALPMVPHNVRHRIEEQRRAFDDMGACPVCAMLEEEVLDGERVISDNDHFVAFIPYAAFSPFHVWIVPVRHGPTFLDQTSAELFSMASILKDVLARIYVGLNDPDFNYNIRSAPNRDRSSSYIHWYLSLVPRVTTAAGFELGSGMYINPSLPEESAKFLRDQDPLGVPARTTDEQSAAGSPLARILEETSY